MHLSLRPAFAKASGMIRDLVEKSGFDADYYFLEDDGAKDVAYKSVVYNWQHGKNPDETRDLVYR